MGALGECFRSLSSSQRINISNWLIVSKTSLILSSGSSVIMSMSIENRLGVSVAKSRAVPPLNTKFRLFDCSCSKSVKAYITFSINCGSIRFCNLFLKSVFHSIVYDFVSIIFYIIGTNEIILPNLYLLIFQFLLLCFFGQHIYASLIHLKCISALHSS